MDPIGIELCHYLLRKKTSKFAAIKKMSDRPCQTKKDEVDWPCQRNEKIDVVNFSLIGEGAVELKSSASTWLKIN